jgi:general secretion pathway protein K
MEHISEMIRVKGISKILFLGATEKPGVRDYATIYGKTEEKDSYYFDGKININTAPHVVLQALLSPEDQEMAQAVIDFRETIPAADAKQVFADAAWYKDAPGCGDLEINPDLITTESDLFHIEASGISQNINVTVISIVKRREIGGKHTCDILSWKVI